MCTFSFLVCITNVLCLTFDISEEAWYLTFFYLAQVLIQLQRTESNQVENQNIVLVAGKSSVTWPIPAIKWASWFWDLELKRFTGPSCPTTQTQEHWTQACIHTLQHLEYDLFLLADSSVTASENMERGSNVSVTFPPNENIYEY